MSSSGKKLSGKMTTLNPNASAFVPSSFRSSTEKRDKGNISILDTSETSRRPYLDYSGLNTLNGSEDEAHHFWRHQLPEDITPDFKSSIEDDLSLAGLSINDGINDYKIPIASGSRFLGTSQNEETEFNERMTYSDLSSKEYDLWEDRFINSDHNLTPSMNGREGSSSVGFLDDLLNEQTSLGSGEALDPLTFLTLQFPGFAADSLAEVYYANGCDLNSTIEILAQLELQVDSNNGFSQATNTKSISTPSFNSMDFPGLPTAESHNEPSKYVGREAHQPTNLAHEPFPFLKASTSGGVLRGGNGGSVGSRAPDFASAVRRLASQDSGHWKLERSTSPPLTGLHGRQARAAFAEKMQQTSSPVWLETGDAVAHLYSEFREEARDFARLRNTFFEQARQAFLIGNKSLAKDLSLKGQFYNMKMKEAHEKARDAIYRQRNPGGERGKQPLIDLHGLHVNEAVNVLRHELAVLRRTARAGGQRLQVMVCVGTGHHTKGLRTPARLPAAVQRYLAEEGLPFSEEKPGLLRVLIR